MPREFGEYLVEGQTAPIDKTLYDGDNPATRTAIDGTNQTVSLELRNRARGLVNVTGDVSWISAAAGTVRFSPAAEDLKADGSPYTATFWVTDATSKTKPYPNQDPDVWRVRRP